MSTPFAMAAVTLTVAPMLVAQQRQVRAAPDPTQWFADLRDDEKAWRATQRIAAQGAAVVQPLLELIEQRVDVSEDDQVGAMATWALVKVGDPARTAAPRLFRMLGRLRRSGLLERQLYWAIGELGSRDEEVASSLAPELRRRRPQEHRDSWNTYEWNIACLRLELGPTPECSRLLELLRSDDLSSLVAAADVLVRDGRGHDRELRLALLAAFRGAVEAQEREAWVYRDRAVLELARAVTARCPAGEQRTDAQARLVRYFDPDVRLEAVRQLAGCGEPAMRPLWVALGDSAREIRCEAATALGTLGSAAQEAVPALETLAAGNDKQLAECARASLRAIRAATAK